MPANGNAAVDLRGGSDKRTTFRRRMLKAAQVVVCNRMTIDCVIRDQSESGARLVFAAPTKLEDEFHVLILATQMLVPARLAWQRGTAAGVTFTGPPRLFG